MADNMTDEKQNQKQNLTKDQKKQQIRADKQEKHIPERILEARIVGKSSKANKQKQYKIKWIGYSEDECTWEPAATFDEDPAYVELVKDFAKEPPPAQTGKAAQQAARRDITTAKQTTKQRKRTRGSSLPPPSKSGSPSKQDSLSKGPKSRRLSLPQAAVGSPLHVALPAKSSSPNSEATAPGVDGIAEPRACATLMPPPEARHAKQAHSLALEQRVGVLEKLVQKLQLDNARLIQRVAATERNAKNDGKASQETKRFPNSEFKEHKKGRARSSSRSRRTSFSAATPRRASPQGVTNHSATSPPRSTSRKPPSHANAVSPTNPRTQLAITGVPYRKGENLRGIVMSVALAAGKGVRLEENDFQCTRAIAAGSPIEWQESLERTPKIVVQLATEALKDRLRERPACRLTVKDAGHLERVPENILDRPIYINENLTRSQSTLFWKTRLAKRQMGWGYAWTRNGNILLRRREGDEAILVDDDRVLDRLTEGYRYERRRERQSRDGWERDGRRQGGWGQWGREYNDRSRRSSC